MRPAEPLGAPSRVAVRKVVRTTYRLEWEYDGVTPVGEYGEQPEMKPVRRRTVKTYFSRPAAYRAAALRLIFGKRDRMATGRDGIKSTGCRACAAAYCGPEEPDQCRYHGGPGFDELVERLAGWLRWRDGVPNARSRPTPEERSEPREEEG